MGGEAELRLTVRIQDSAQVAPKILREAELEANSIFSKAGIKIAWVECTGPGLPSEPGCGQPLSPRDIVLRILPQSMASQAPLNADTFGFTAISTDERPSLLASVFYARVEGVSRALGYSRAVTLGYIMAHEIGHLLLGTNSHSPFGIMRARWTREDLLRPLRFSPTQAEAIRAEVEGRSRLATQEQEVVKGGPVTRVAQ